MKCHLGRRPALVPKQRQGGSDFVVDVAPAGNERTRAEVRRMSGASARWVALGTMLLGPWLTMLLGPFPPPPSE